MVNICTVPPAVPENFKLADLLSVSEAGVCCTDLVEVLFRVHSARLIKDGLNMDILNKKKIKLFLFAGDFYIGGTRCLSVVFSCLQHCCCESYITSINLFPANAENMVSS